MKCSRTVCKRQTTDPKKAGWTYIEFDPPPPKTGWWCPACFEGIIQILEAQGGEPTIERLH
jgi:hypothetical protein